MSYSTIAELRARVSAAYTDHPDIADDAAATKLLEKASELIDEETFGRAARVDLLDPDNSATTVLLSRAACDQVEFWLEVGEEHDVAGLKGSLVAGRVQVHPVPNQLGQRARRSLRQAGLLWRGVASR